METLKMDTLKIDRQGNNMRDELWIALTEEFVKTGTHAERITLDRRDYADLVHDCGSLALYTAEVDDGTGKVSHLLHINGPAGPVVVDYDRAPTTSDAVVKT